jgi:four helix bundle protein
MHSAQRAGMMAAYQNIEDRTYQFALRIIRMARALPKDSASQAIGRQVLRSGTSVGANVEEAIGASTKKDFANKVAIACKEALELKKILSKTVSTARKRLADSH